jgi:hypothetical protein
MDIVIWENEGCHGGQAGYVPHNMYGEDMY